jgi:UDP-glucose 4-epimerase
MSRRFLVTGGAGFIGSHLTEALLAGGHRVRVLDDLSTGSLANLAGVMGRPALEFVRGSVGDENVVEEAVAGADYVYHLAAAVGVELVVRSPVYTIEDNVRGTENVLAAAARRGVGVLLASTSEVYGKSERDCFRESDDLLIGPPTVGRWSYACSKLLDEFLALAYWREKRLPVTIVRLFNTVGPRQTGRYGMVVPRFVRAAVRGEPLLVHGDGMQTRCFCHVLDVVRAMVGLAEQPAAVGEVFNVGSREEVTIGELAQRVVALTGGRSPVRFVPYEEAYTAGFADLRRRVPCTEKVAAILGWQPTMNLAEILQQMVVYERECCDAENRFQK